MTLAQTRRLNGVGIGLRQPLAQALFDANWPHLRFVELHPENYIGRGGTYIQTLERALERAPVLTHGLTLGLGNAQPFERSYLEELRRFLHGVVRAPWHSEHLCFTEADGRMVHDLLPLAFDHTSIGVAVERIRELRDALELPVAVENISFYAHFAKPDMSELEFFLEVIERSDGLILLDVNNVYVNSINHGFNARAFIDQIPAERVVQLHIAGHFTRRDGLIIDTHAEAICEDVYQLLEYTLRRLGPKPVLLERDDNFPDFAELLAELERLQRIYERATAEPQRLIASV